jgi:hypothetical protein
LRKAFGQLLRSHGFRAVEREVGRFHARRTFADGARYIAVAANVDPREAPFYCSVALGEGGRDMPERDWNAVALWRLVQDRAPERIQAGREPYGIAGVEDLHPVVDRMVADLAAYADDFLRGDLERFRRVRAAQNRDREPYTIWAPDEAGNYTSRPDPLSTALKARFEKAE